MLTGLFGVIDIGRLSADEFSNQLANAYDKMRFADRPNGYEGSDEIGAALLGCPNFGRKSSGWFDKNGVTFPEDLVPTTEPEILEHLRWMIDSRTNREAVQCLWKVFDREVKALDSKGVGSPVPTSIDRLARRLAEAVNRQPELAYSLLTGRLGSTLAWFRDRPGSDEARIWAPMAWSMFLVWAYFDLQIIAYRLFSPEWFAIEQDRKHPKNMDGRAFEKLAGQLLDFAKECKSHFDNGGTLKSASDELKDFIAENNLLDHACQHAANLGIPPKPSATDQAALSGYLSFLEEFLTAMVDELKFKGQLIEKSVVSAVKFDGSRGSRTASSGKTTVKESQRSDLEASTLRYDVPGLAAMLYAIRGVVRELGEISLPLNKSNKEVRGLRFRSQRAAFAVRNLFAIYRDIFIRPARANPKLSDDDVASFAERAAVELSNGNADPGLEPHEFGQARPWLGGVPTMPQLPSADPVLGPNTATPDEWEANEKPWSGHSVQEKAVKEILTDSQSDPILAAKVKRLDDGFGHAASERQKII